MVCYYIPLKEALKKNGEKFGILPNRGGGGGPPDQTLKEKTGHFKKHKEKKPEIDQTRGGWGVPPQPCGSKY